MYCFTHKKDGMIDVLNMMCIYDNCTTRAHFNKEGEKRPLYCNMHKEDGMINIKDKPCIYPGCKTLPNYNVKDAKTGIYCKLHKLDGMIDVKHNCCIYPGCRTRPNYNIDGENKAIYCFNHKEDNMVDINNIRCIYPNCKTRPNYNFEGYSIPIYCTMHKQDNMIDISHPMCKTNLCYTRVTNKYEGYCLNCFIHLFPDRPNARNYKTKENATTDYIIENYPGFSWVIDTKIQDGCSRKRPDLLLDLGYQVLIIEIDENQHESYDCSCENKRLMLLSQDVGHRPIIFIRFNPDDYTIKDNKITSCWGINKNGICTIKKTKQKEWNTRLDSLNEQIKYWSNPENKTEKTIEVIELFYDA
jgi:hypothetical protein